MSTTPIPPVEPPKSVTRDIREAVKNGLLNANDVVKADIILQFVNEEVGKRKDATMKVLSKIEEIEREIRKVRPTHAGYDQSGEPVGTPVFTKEQVDGLKKSNEQLTKLTNALELALVKNDFTKVFELGAK